MEKFKKLGLGEGTLSVLHKMGFTVPTEIQEKAIPFALEGRDIIANSATGSGKTLAFAAPILENLESDGEIQALILTPTRELAEQVAEAVKKFSNNRLEVAAIYGGMNMLNQIKQLRRTDVVVGTPGRILDHLDRRTLDLSQVKILVLDEFDRMLDMGFSKDVGKIINQCPKKRQTMLFSATSSVGVENLTKQYTNNPVDVSVESYVDEAKLTHVYYDVPTNLKFSLLVQLLKNETSDLVMIFSNTRRNADFVVKNLNSLGINAIAIHGGLDQSKRLRIMKEFDMKKIHILVCTDVAARGLDIKGISHVYNYDIPILADDYVHRVGRTARAGKEGKAINILAERDYDNFTNLLRRKSFDIKAMELPDITPIRIRADFGGRSNDYGDRRERDYSPRRGNSSRRSSSGRNGGRDFGRKSTENRNARNTRRRY
jgi:ATP-dependent RNA helicase DeaD